MLNAQSVMLTCGDVKPSRPNRSRNHFTDEFKASAVAKYKELLNQDAAAKAMGIQSSTLYSWLKNAGVK